MFALTGLILIVFTQHAPVSLVTLSPQVNVTMEHVTVVEGGRVTLPCTVDTEDQQVIWVSPRKILISLHDRRVMDDHRISVERPYIKVWNLLIRTVRYNDSGTYECRVNSTPRQIKKVRLEVQVPPKILSHVSSDKVTLTEGETATLVCNVTGIPTPNVTWYKRNYRIIGGSKERIGKEGEVLMIKNITRHCDDIYECFVDNGVPPAVSKAIRVVVNFMPEVVLPNPKRIGQQLGKETILDCVIYANPQAVTKWLRHGREIMKSTNDNKYDIDVIHNDLENSITLSLRIRDLTPKDYGAYECYGSSKEGNDKDVMILYETKPPKTTTTTTTTTPAVIHVQAGHHQRQGNTVFDGRHPHTDYHQQGSGDYRDNDNSHSQYNYNNQGHGDDGRDREEVLREWEKKHRIGKDDPDSSSLNSPKDGADYGETWSVSDPKGSKSSIVNPNTCLSILLLFIVYSLTK